METVKHQRYPHEESNTNIEETEPANSFVMIEKEVSSRPSNIAAVSKQKWIEESRPSENIQ